MDTVCREHAASIRTMYSICRSLDSLLEKALGPNGKNTLLNTPTGQILITDVGCTVLQSVNVDHPLATMIIKSIVDHHSYAGDGSKTFMLYLTSILSTIANYTEEELDIHQSEQRHSLLCALQYIRSQMYSNILLPAVQKNCHVIDISASKDTTLTVMHNLVKSHLCGKYTEAIRSHLSSLLVSFLCLGVSDFRSLYDEITAAIDNFNLLCVEVDSMLPLSSYVYEGIVIQRDFLNFRNYPAECHHTRFMLLHSSFTKHGELSATFEVKDVAILDKAFLWKNHCSTSLVNWVQKNNVNLILSTGAIDDTLHTLCSKAGILVVQFVDKEDFARLEMLFQITPIEFISDLFDVDTDSFIGCTVVCKARVFGQKRFVCLKLPEHNHTQKSCDHVADRCMARKFCTIPECLKRQLIICGMSAGACRQIRLDLLHALKSLRLWLDDNWMMNGETSQCSAVHIAGGGSFELTCYNAVQDFMRQNTVQDNIRLCCEAMCAAFLAVPLRLLHNSFRPKNATVVYVKGTTKSNGESICGFDCCSGYQLPVDTTILEPLTSKLILLDHVLELTEQLLRIDSLLRIKKSLSEDEIVQSRQ